MHNYRSNQSAPMTRFGTDLRHQYGIFVGKSQTSFTGNATRAGSEEGRLFSQVRISLERKEISEKGKQQFSAHEVYLFMFQNGLERKDAIFVIVPL